jgi:uncharacterized membrane protein
MHLFGRLRTGLISGMLVAVPFAVTLWVFRLVAGTLQAPGVLLLENIKFVLPERLTPFYDKIAPIEPLIGFVLGVMFILLLGFTTKNYLGKRFLSWWESLVARVPILSTVYGGVKQLLEALFSSKKAAFERVVLVEWPRPGLYSVAFHTGDSEIQTPSGDKYINVFLPTTPNPTTGFYFMVRDSEVVHTEMSVDEGFKMLMSAGIVSPNAVIVAPDTFDGDTVP